MKILHLCTYQEGGAGAAAHRLHEGLLDIGLNSVFCGLLEANGRNTLAAVPDKGRCRMYAINSRRLRVKASQLLPILVGTAVFDSMFSGDSRDVILRQKPDLVNLHWVEDQFVTIADLAWLSKKRIPVVWTLHDMSPLTGGVGYREEAGLPVEPFGPIKLQGGGAGLSERLLRRRTTALEAARLAIVAPSRWLAEEARRSPVFTKHPVLCIPYGIDLKTFTTAGKQKARASLGLPVDRRILLFGADTFSSKRKGWHHLQLAIKLADDAWTPGRGKPLIVLFGASGKERMDSMAWETRNFGRIENSATLAKLYASADVFACPSREDNLPNTVIESLACGTPVIGFKIGGLPDMIENGVNGFLADPFDERQLANQLLGLGGPDSPSFGTAAAAREIAEAKFPAALQARRYHELYQRTIAGN